MFSKVLNQSADGKVKHVYHEDDERVIIQTLRDESKVVEDNKALHNMTSSLDRYGDGRVVLRQVPMWLIQDWTKRGWYTKDNFHKCLADERAAPYKVFGK